jgi:hypothetical protein
MEGGLADISWRCLHPGDQTGRPEPPTPGDPLSLLCATTPAERGMGTRRDPTKNAPHPPSPRDPPGRQTPSLAGGLTHFTSLTEHIC